jgi:hypothetical protein
VEIMSGIAAPLAQAPVFLKDTERWEAFDLKQLGEHISGYAESLFDGRYVYYGPERNYDNAGCSHISHAYMLRYDTWGPFTQKESWQSFDVRSLWPDAGGGGGMIFDGQYVIYAPFRTGGAHEYLINTIALRYDTTRPFDAAEAWSRFDMKRLHKDAGGYVGADSDREYAYFTPLYSGRSSLFARYKLSMPFEDPASWDVVDPSYFNLNLKGYVGCQCVDGYVYYSPCFNDITGEMHGNMLRYNVALPFDAKEAWEWFDIKPYKPQCAGYDGLVFDGFYLYYVPYYCRKPWHDKITHGHVLRYDTRMSFQDSAAWESVNMAATVYPELEGFIGGGFDGRLVYLAPVKNQGGYHGNVAAYDTTLSFQDPAAWCYFDVAQFGERFNYYDGRVISDGSHMYFVACGPGAMMIRFRFGA